MSDSILTGYPTSDYKKMIFFTKEKVIVAKIGGQAGQIAGAALGGVTGSLIGRSRDKGASKKKGQKFLESTPQEILAAEAFNYAIPYTGIEKVELRKNKVKIIAKEKFGKDMKRKTDKTTQKEYYLYEKPIKKIKDFEDQVSLLRTYLSNKLEVK